MNAVAFPVATSLLRQLSGFKGYPKVGAGEDYFATALCECAVSVEHAIAVVRCFDEGFPTLRQLRDAAHSLRPKFEPTRNERAAWEREYGKPDPNWSRNLTGAYQQQKLKMGWQLVRDTVYYTEGPGRFETKDAKFWEQVALRLRRDHPERLDDFRRDDLSTGWEALMASDWAREVQPVPVESARPRITQADLDAAKGARSDEAEENDTVDESEDVWAAGDAGDRWE